MTSELVPAIKRMSVNPSARSSSSATYCGAEQILDDLISLNEVVSSVSSAAAGGAASSVAPKAIDALVKKPRRVCLICIENRPLINYAFSSRLSLFRKRQSVPSAMIFCGLDLIRPTSWRRRAYHLIVSSASYSVHL